MGRRDTPVESRDSELLLPERDVSEVWFAGCHSGMFFIRTGSLLLGKRGFGPELERGASLMRPVDNNRCRRGKREGLRTPCAVQRLSALDGA